MYRYHCLMIRAHLIEFSHRLIIVMYYCVFIVRPRAVSRHFYLLLNSFVIKVISLWNSTSMISTSFMFYSPGQNLGCNIGGHGLLIGQRL
jgi:hypothetical protein